MHELTWTISLPQRSQLYAPAALGLGTGLVESLASYLARVADSHAVSRADLLGYLVADSNAARVVKSHRVYNLLSVRGRELNGTQNVAATWSTLVAQQTLRTSIDQLTLLPWRRLVSIRTLLHRSQCWCPDCLDEWRQTGQTPYWPLLWSLRVVTVCPSHRRPLAQRCPGCGAAIPALTARAALGCCGKCQTWLGQPIGQGPVQAATDVSAAALQAATGMLQVLATHALYPAEAVTLDKLALLLEHCLQTTHSRPPALARQLGLSLTTLYRLLAREDLINMPTLLRLLAGCGVAIADFVQMPVAAIIAAGYLDHLISHLASQQPKTPAPLQRGQRASPDLLCAAQIGLQTALQEDDPPPLEVLARHLGLTAAKVLWRHWPQLCQQILEKRQSQRQPAVWGERLAAILDATEVPPSVVTIAAQLKTSAVTLRQYFPDEMARIQARRHIVRDVPELRRQVAAFLTAEPPVSFTEVVRRLDVKAHHLRQHCPDLQRDIVQRFAAYQHARAIERERQAAVAIHAAVVSLDAAGQFPTKAKVAELLGRIRRPTLERSEAEAFNQAMDELGLRPR